MNPLRKLWDDRVLMASLLLLLIVSILNPSEIVNYPQFVNWDTILTLASLFLITTALWESRYMEKFAVKII
ncbi:MAG: citrate transporter, partial [Euryarchaeota archaeon]|nr:citrate transporter [Euryarchaeota archaeon]